MRGSVLGVVAAAAAVVMVVGPAGASANDPYRAVSDALVVMTNADQWLFDDGCIGGTSASDPLVMIAAAPEASCSVPQGVPVVATPAGIFCWQDTNSGSHRECLEQWNNQDFRLLSASIEVDGEPVRVGRHNVNSTVSIPEDWAWPQFGYPDLAPGTTQQTFAVVMGTVLTNLSVGEHEVHLAFEYGDGFAGDSLVTLTVTA